MMMSDKIFSWLAPPLRGAGLATAVICSLLLTAGCAQTASLALKFTPQDLTTYKLTTEAQRHIKWEGPLTDETAFRGGQTGNKIEMTFTRQIQSVDDKGNAVAEITIEGLKYLSIIRDNTVLDFDSSREKDKNIFFTKLIATINKIKVTIPIIK